ncbi:MAG TPA: tripartite tricarboxylate transporter substrate binding protein [Xanthobacteraceae bacterium]|jgi:tripartite-type tricarboxylate transporter receptor subunit TctC
MTEECRAWKEFAPLFHAFGSNYYIEENIVATSGLRQSRLFAGRLRQDPPDQLEGAVNVARRTFLELAGSAAALLAHPCVGRAQAYPARPVRVLVGYAPGGSADILARLMGQWLSERLGQQFIVENRPGAGTNIATEAVIRAPADGYTLLLVSAANFINATLYEKLAFNFIHDTSPVLSLSREPNVVVVHPSVPANSIPELIAYAKANPGIIAMASGGTGASSHVSGELFKMLTGIKMVHVPYRGAGPALAGLLGGEVQIYFCPMSSAVEHIRAGRLRALAVTTRERSTAMPAVPSVSEFVPGYESSQSYGLAAPKGTPAEIIGKLNAEANSILVDPAMQARLAALGETAIGGSAADFARLIAEETDKWAKVVKHSGASPG